MEISDLGFSPRRTGDCHRTGPGNRGPFSAVPDIFQQFERRAQSNASGA